MKVAIYSRIIDYELQNGVQQLFHELVRQKIEPVVHFPFLEKISSSFSLPENVSVFHDSKDLDKSIDFLISLGGTG